MALYLYRKSEGVLDFFWLTWRCCIQTGVLLWDDPAIWYHILVLVCVLLQWSTFNDNDPNATNDNLVHKWVIKCVYLVIYYKVFWIRTCYVIGQIYQIINFTQVILIFLCCYFLIHISLLIFCTNFLPGDGLISGDRGFLEVDVYHLIWLTWKMSLIRGTTLGSRTLFFWRTSEIPQHLWKIWGRDSVLISYM